MRVIDTVRETIADVLSASHSSEQSPSSEPLASARNVSYCLPHGVYYPHQHLVDTPIYNSTHSFVPRAAHFRALQPGIMYSNTFSRIVIQPHLEGTPLLGRIPDSRCRTSPCDRDPPRRPHIRDLRWPATRAAQRLSGGARCAVHHPCGIRSLLRSSGSCLEDTGGWRFAASCSRNSKLLAQFIEFRSCVQDHATALWTANPLNRDYKLLHCRVSQSLLAAINHRRRVRINLVKNISHVTEFSCV